MAEESAGMDRVPEFLRGPIHEYAGLVRKLAGANARALTLFGAVVAGSFDPDRHVVRNVLVLGEVDLEVLKRLAEHGAKLGKQRISAPLIMTPEYIAESLDTFPLELLEIQQQHVTLFGQDHFVELTFAESDLRLQCEREIKAILIGLRQGLLAAAGRDRILGELEVDVAAGLLRTLRGMLWLKGDKKPKPSAAVVDAVETVTDRKLHGLRTALDPTAEHSWPEFQRLYEDVAALSVIVNAW
ncbi:MAG: hypothetical protein JSV19_08015 [Phycisphaerales bacterium]|nr:MAG: hypothetical protein JSV19_08015 [Phycisphaerales bacterium]